MRDVKHRDILILSQHLVMLRAGIAEQWNRVVTDVNTFDEVARSEIPETASFFIGKDGLLTTSPEMLAHIEAKLHPLHDQLRFDLYLLCVAVTMAQKTIQSLMSHRNGPAPGLATIPELVVIWGRIHSTFRPYKLIRDHFEHLDERLPDAPTRSEKLKAQPSNNSTLKISYGTIDLTNFEMMFGSDTFSFSTTSRDQVLSAVDEVIYSARGKESA